MSAGRRHPAARDTVPGLPAAPVRKLADAEVASDTMSVTIRGLLSWLRAFPTFWVLQPTFWGV